MLPSVALAFVTVELEVNRYIIYTFRPIASNISFDANDRPVRPLIECLIKARRAVSGSHQAVVRLSFSPASELMANVFCDHYDAGDDIDN